eukprot:10443384-Lingulodinium_polyedra.AAC.1
MFGLSVTTVIWKTPLRVRRQSLFVESWRPSPLPSALINWFEVVAVEQMQEHTVSHARSLGLFLARSVWIAANGFVGVLSVVGFRGVTAIVVSLDVRGF